MAAVVADVNIKYANSWSNLIHTSRGKKKEKNLTARVIMVCILTVDVRPFFLGAVW